MQTHYDNYSRAERIKDWNSSPHKLIRIAYPNGTRSYLFAFDTNSKAKRLNDIKKIVQAYVLRELDKQKELCKDFTHAELLFVCLRMARAYVEDFNFTINELSVVHRDVQQACFNGVYLYDWTFKDSTLIIDNPILYV